MSGNERDIYLNDTNISFPLDEATRIIAGDPSAAPDLSRLTRLFDELGAGDLNPDNDDSNKVVVSPGDYIDWPFDQDIEDLYTMLAPIIPDGAYAEFENRYYDLNSNIHRLVIAGDKIVKDYPRLTWDNPEEIATKQIEKDKENAR